MSGLFVRYGPPPPSEEPWRCVEVPSGVDAVDILSLVKEDDVFGDSFPIVRVFASDGRPSAEPSAGGLVEVGTISVGSLQSVTSVYIQRSGGTASDFTTVFPGPVKGPLAIKGSTHRLRVYNEAVEAFASVDGVSSAGSLSCVMLESVPLASLSPSVTKMFRYSDHVHHALAFDTHHTVGGHATESALHEEWSQSAIPSDRSGLEGGKWKGRIRKGVPSVHRHFVLPALLERCASVGRQSLEEALRWTYGWAPPCNFDPEFYPTFGAQYMDSIKSSIPLLPSGWLQHKFILTCLAQQQPDITSCPMLPAVVAYLLMVLTPNEAFVMASKLMQLSRRETVSTIRYLPLSDEATSSFVASAIRIASATGPSKAGLEPEILTLLFEDLGVAFFSQTFPHLFALKILDMFAYEGIKILVRIFVGILRVYLPTLGERDLTQFLIGGPMVCDSLFNTCTQSAFDLIVEEGFKISLSKNDISWSGTRPDAGRMLTIRKEIHHWPRLEESSATSKIIGTDLSLYEHIFVHFPLSYSTVKRVFRASNDAWSVSKLYGRMEGQNMSAALILFQLESGMRVGLFTSEMPWKASRSYTGSRTDFLFVTQSSVSTITFYPATSCKKENVLLCEKDHLTAGEGPAFRITGDMHTATSATCPVFSSPQLWADGASVCEVEVFHIE